MSDKSSPPNFSTLLLALGDILDLDRDVVKQVMLMEKREISALTQYCMILSNFDGSAADRGEPDEAKAKEFSGLTINAWQTIASVVTQNKPIFVNPAAPLAAIMEVKGTVVLTKTKDQSTDQVTLKHRNFSKDICTVAELTAGTGFDTIVERLQDFAKFTRQGVVLPVRGDYLHILHFMAPYLKFVVNNNKLTVAVNNYLDSFFFKETEFGFTPKLIPALLQKSLEVNQNNAKRFADVITKANITVPPGAPLFYYLAEQLDLKGIVLPIVLHKPAKAEPDWVSRIGQPPDVLKGDKMPDIWDSSLRKLRTLGMALSEADTNKSALWSWVASSFQQFSQNGFELNFFGNLSNFGRVTALSLLILDYCVTNGIHVVLVGDGPVAARLAELKRREGVKLEIYLPGAKCEDEDVVVTNWNAFFKRDQSGKHVLIASDLPETPTLLEQYKVGKLICYFPNVERLNAKSPENIINVLETKKVEKVEICPWNCRPTPLIQLVAIDKVDTTTRMESRVTFRATVALCNALARRVLSNFLGASLLRLKYVAWRAPKLAKIAKLEECFKDLSKKSETSVLGIAFADTFGVGEITEAEEMFEMEEETIMLGTKTHTDRSKRTLASELKPVDPSVMVDDKDEAEYGSDEEGEVEASETAPEDEVIDDSMFVQETLVPEQSHRPASDIPAGFRDLSTMVTLPAVETSSPSLPPDAVEKSSAKAGSALPPKKKGRKNTASLRKLVSKVSLGSDGKPRKVSRGPT